MRNLSGRFLRDSLGTPFRLLACNSRFESDAPAAPKSADSKPLHYHLRMKVFVTNASGSFAAALLPVLCQSAEVASVTGIDTRNAGFAHAKFRAVQADLADPSAITCVAGHDALVHIASYHSVPQTSSEDDIEASVRPAHRLFQAAHAAGASRLVHISSAAVYGPVVHANEQSPLRPLAGFAYAEQQARLEALLALDFPHCVRLRPHLIVGPNAHPSIRKVLHQPLYPRGSEPEPLFQCVHEQDLAGAVLLCLRSRAHGAYNIAAEDSFTVRDAIRARRGFSFGVPASAARSALRLATRYLRYEIDPVWIERAAHTVLINCRRAMAELGWRTRYSAQEALAAT
jgi:UDP-glucose 4-epimerase